MKKLTKKSKSKNYGFKIILARSFLNKYLSQISLGFLLLVLFISHLLYVLKTGQYPQEDEHSYLSLAIQFHDILKNSSFNTFNEIMAIQTYRQIFFPLFLSLPLVVFGTENSYKLFLFINYFFYAGSIICTYLLAKEFLSKVSSVIAAYIFAFFGFPLFYLHFLYSETATTFFVVLSLLFLAKSKNLTQEKYIILFAISISLATLVRWLAPVFVIGPFIYLIFKLLSSKNKSPVKKLLLLRSLSLIALFGIFPTFLLYYIPKWNFFVDYIKGNVSGSPIWVQTVDYLSRDLVDPFSKVSIMYYVNVISQQTIWLFILFLVGFLFGVICFKKYLFLVLAFIFPYAYFTFITIFKLDRFIVPVYPIIAIISVIFLDQIKNKKIYFSLILLTLIISFLNFLGASWGLGPMGKVGLKSVVFPKLYIFPRVAYLTPVVWPPTKEFSNAKKTVDTILNNSDSKNKKTIVLSTFSFYPYENAITSISSYEKREKVSVEFIRNLGSKDYDKLFRRIKNSDFMIVKDKNAIDDYRYKDEKEAYMFKQFNLFYKTKLFSLPRYKLIDRVEVPVDKTHILIYKRVGDISNNDIGALANLMITASPSSSLFINDGFEKFLKDEE